MPPKPFEPSSVRAESALRALVEKLEPRDQLPPVGDLASDLHVSRRTVSKVLQKMADEGLVKIWPGYGTFKL
jgi:DNA-binding GntR family transcriptional regulator